MESFSRPLHRRKLSNANNGFSLSAKHPYQDVFSGAPTTKFGAPGFPSGVEDYCEIFGGGSRGSSIPVLDLSGLDDVKVVSEDFRSSKLDYSNIFGGFRDEDVAVPYEEMFSAAKRGKTSSGKARASSEGSDQFSPSGMHKESSCEATNQSVDKLKHFNLSYHKTSQRSNDGSNGMTQIAQLHAIPGFTYFIDESSHLKKTEPSQQAPHVKNEVHRNRSFSGEIFKNGRDREGDLLVTKKQSSDGVVKDRSGSSWDGCHFNDKVYIAHGELDGRSQSTRGASTSSPTTSDIAGHPKQSNTSVLSSKTGASEKGVGVASTSPSSSDEELDANSVAAISAATLKKAIAKAQESIRLAKELMERKNDVITASRIRKSKGSLKSKDTSIECNTRSSRGNGMERHRKIGIGLPPFAEVGMGIPFRNADFESYVKFKEQQCISGMVKLDSQTENIEASERDVAATRYPEVVSSRTENTKTLASQQVDGMNHSQLFVEKNKHVYNLDEMNTHNRTSELGEGVGDLRSSGDISPKINVDRKAKAPVLDKGNYDSAQVRDIEGCVNSKITKEYCFSKEKVNGSPDLRNFENIKNNLESTFDEQWSLKNSQNSKELLSEEKVVFLETENYDLHNDREKPSENGTLKHKDLVSRIARKKLEDDHEVEENKNKLRRTSDEEETELVSKEAYLWVENDEKLQHGCGREGIKSRQQDLQEGHDTGVHQPALSEKEIIHAHEAEEREEKRERSEMEGLQNISIETCQSEETEAIENQTDKYPQNIKIEARHEAEEFVSLLEASDQSEDNQDTSVAPGVADKPNYASAGNEPDHNESPRSSETQEACGYEQVPEALYELVGCQKDGAIEESSSSREENILETACELRNATECDTAEGKVRDSYEASYDDAEEVNIGSTCMNGTDNLPSERVIFETESLSNVIQENVGCDESYFVPEVQPSTEEPDNNTCADINLEQTRVVGNNREPELCSNPDAGDNLRVHEHVENEETIKGVGVAVDQVEKNKDIGIAHRQKKAWSSLPRECKENEPGNNDEGIKTELMEESSNLSQKTVLEDETKEHLQKVAEDKDNRRITDVDRRQREREKDRIAVERVIREARERAFAEARERAERAAVERATAEVRQRVMAEAREKLEKASASNKVSAGKASIEAKLKAERAAVERATAEARERALEKALSQKTTTETRAQAEGHGPEKFAGATRENGLKHSLSSSDLDKVDGSNSESAQRRKARLERHQRIMERAAKALAEKNKRDFLAQKEQTERNRLAEGLDADVKRWASGKEGNLRALLSTLQYILGSESGWQPISLTEIITSAAVKKAYRKATLYVHPDKLQQRGANIQQKYVCEKVFDLLKAAWNKFNSEER